MQKNLTALLPKIAGVEVFTFRPKTLSWLLENGMKISHKGPYKWRFFFSIQNRIQLIHPTFEPIMNSFEAMLGWLVSLPLRMVCSNRALKPLVIQGSYNFPIWEDQIRSKSMVNLRGPISLIQYSA